MKKSKHCEVEGQRFITRSRPHFVVVEVDRDLFPIVLSAMGSDLFMSKPAVITVLQFHLQFLPRNVPVRPTVSLTGNHLILPGR